jgi:hypothetical protein
MIKTATCMAFAAACLTAVAIAPGAQAQLANTGGSAEKRHAESYGSTYENRIPQNLRDDASANWSARQNVLQSDRYTHIWRAIQPSVRLGCARNADRLPTRNFMQAVSPVSTSIPQCRARPRHREGMVRVPIRNDARPLWAASRTPYGAESDPYRRSIPRKVVGSAWILLKSARSGSLL